MQPAGITTSVLLHRLLCIWLMLGQKPAVGFLVVRSLTKKVPARRLNSLHVLKCSPSEDNIHKSVRLTSRRTLLRSIVAATTAASTVVSSSILTIAAPPVARASTTDGDTIWLTGKSPKVPDQKPKDKNDVGGTRKDPKFFRSLADCKNQSENSLGADGYAKTKEDCLSECQDICCMTYEQCTFPIVPRM